MLEAESAFFGPSYASAPESVFAEVGLDVTCIDIDKKKYIAGVTNVKAGTKKELSEMEKAWKGMGTKAELTYDKMRAKAQQQYDAIKRNAFSTADDIVRAEKAKNDKIARINRQQFGKQKRRVNNFVNGESPPWY